LVRGFVHQDAGAWGRWAVRDSRPGLGQDGIADRGQRQHEGTGGGGEAGPAGEGGDLARVDAALEGPLALAGPKAVVVSGPAAVRAAT
jgi:hypothetical protein